MSNRLHINNLDDLALSVGLPKAILTRYIFQADSFYKIFKQKKKSGRGYRHICAPSRELKGIQQWINVFILHDVSLSNHAVGFRKGLSIKDNAKPHLKQDFVCTIDIEDFFPSIGAKRVTAIFKSIGFPKDVAGSLSRLTTFKKRLPQGAPSSPQLANIVLRRLDMRISQYCSKRQWHYTRYCDDISISGEGGISPHELKLLEEIVNSEGFKVNHRKTRIKRRNSRQEVTGLVVNDTPHLARQRRKNLRAMFHQAFLYPEKFETRLNELAGHLAYFRSIHPNDIQSIERYKIAIQRVKELSAK